MDGMQRAPNERHWSKGGVIRPRMNHACKGGIIKIRKEWHQNVQEQILDLQNPMDNPHNANDRVPEERLLFCQIPIKTLHTLDDIRENAILQWCIGQKTDHNVITRM